MKKGEIIKEEVHVARDYSNYTIGILSIVLSLITSWGIGGIILGIIGLVRIKSSKSTLSGKAKVLNTIGLILGIIIFIVTLIVLLISGIDWATLTGQQ